MEHPIATASPDLLYRIFHVAVDTGIDAADDEEIIFQKLAEVRDQLDLWRKASCVCKRWRAIIRPLQNSPETLDYVQKVVGRAVSCAITNNNSWTQVSAVMGWCFGVKQSHKMNLFVLKTIFRKMERGFSRGLQSAGEVVALSESCRDILLGLLEETCCAIHQFPLDQEVAEYGLAFITFILEHIRRGGHEMYGFHVLLSTEAIGARRETPMNEEMRRVVFGPLDTTMVMPAYVPSERIVSAVVFALQHHGLEREVYRWGISVMKLLHTMPALGDGCHTRASDEYFLYNDGVSALIRGARLCHVHGRRASDVNIMVFHFIENLFVMFGSEMEHDLKTTIVGELGHVLLLNFLQTYRAMGDIWGSYYYFLCDMYFKRFELRDDSGLEDYAMESIGAGALVFYKTMLGAPYCHPNTADKIQSVGYMLADLLALLECNPNSIYTMTLHEHAFMKTLQFHLTYPMSYEHGNNFKRIVDIFTETCFMERNYLDFMHFDATHKTIETIFRIMWKQKEYDDDWKPILRPGFCFIQKLIDVPEISLAVLERIMAAPDNSGIELLVTIHQKRIVVDSSVPYHDHHGNCVLYHDTIITDTTKHILGLIENSSPVNQAKLAAMHIHVGGSTIVAGTG